MQARGHKSGTVTGGDESGRAKLRPRRLLLPQQAPSPAERTRGHSRKGGGWRRAEAAPSGATLPSVRTKSPPGLLTKESGAQPQPPAGDAALPEPHTGRSPTPRPCAGRSHAMLSPAGWVRPSVPLLLNPAGHPHRAPAPFPPPQAGSGLPFGDKPPAS